MKYNYRYRDNDCWGCHSFELRFRMSNIISRVNAGSWSNVMQKLRALDAVIGGPRTCHINLFLYKSPAPVSVYRDTGYIYCIYNAQFMIWLCQTLKCISAVRAFNAASFLLDATASNSSSYVLFIASIVHLYAKFQRK